MVPIPNFKKPKDMTKTYTTEEIITRLKTHETFVAIKMLLGDLIRYISIGNQYACRDVSLSTFTILDDLKYKREFDISEFSKYFMFLSDYEAMKSEDVPLKETAPEEFNELSQNHLDSLRLLRHNGLFDKHNSSPQIPEWLQRERVAHWSRCYMSCQSPIPEECSECANKDLEQFDKRFLTQKD